MRRPSSIFMANSSCGGAGKPGGDTHAHVTRDRGKRTAVLSCAGIQSPMARGRV